MTTNWFQRTTLAVAGLTASTIGLTITFLPSMFYASYGIALDADPNLLSEIRAPGANLAALGFLMLGGALRARWFASARLIAITVFFSFAFGRLVSWSIDGVPDTSIIAALAIEIVIGSLVLLASVGMRKLSKVRTLTKDGYHSFPG